MENEATRATSPASWLAAGLISLIVSSAVAVNGASNLLSSTNPTWSLRLNPLRSEERISLAVDKMEEDGTRELIETGLALSPIDARLFSLLGILAERDDDLVQASRLYRHALELLPTEFQALTRQLAGDINNRNFLDGAEKLEILARRWPPRWSAVEPALPHLLSDPQAYDRIMERFGAYPLARNLLIGSLSRNSEWLPFAYDLLLDWHEDGVGDLERLISQVTQAFLHDAQFAQASLLFKLTRPEGISFGLIYNSDFGLPLSGNPFDWQIRSQAGVSIDQTMEDGESALSVRFLDNPVQFDNIRQFVRLVPGEYDLQLAHSGRDLVMPKPIAIAIECLPSNTVIASEPLAEGTYQRNDTIAFTVPPTGCQLQEIHFLNEKLPMSWKNRYRGTLLIDAISIENRS